MPACNQWAVVRIPVCSDRPKPLFGYFRMSDRCIAVPDSIPIGPTIFWLNVSDQYPVRSMEARVGRREIKFTKRRCSRE